MRKAKKLLLQFLLATIIVSNAKTVAAADDKEKILIDLNLEKGGKISVNPEFLKSDIKYTISKEDTIETLEKVTNISKKDLVGSNPLLKTQDGVDSLVGTTINIYTENNDDFIYYKVQAEETLEEIAKKLKTSVSHLMNDNNLSSSKISKGQIIKSELSLNQRKNIMDNLKDEEGFYDFNKNVTLVKNSKSKIDSDIHFDSIFGSYTGIDISEHNGDINFKKVRKDNIDFVIIRMFDGWFIDYQENKLQKLDKKFAQNVKNCEKAKIPYGIYTYSRATTEKMAEQEAKIFLKYAKEYNINPSWPIYFDIESQEKQPLKTETNKNINSPNFIASHPKQIIKNFKAWANIIASAGYKPGIYTGDNILQKIDPKGTRLTDYEVWGARYKYYDKVCDFQKFDYNTPKYQGDLGMFQFSSSGSISGINGRVDCNISKYKYNSTKENAKTKKLAKK